MVIVSVAVVMCYRVVWPAGVGAAATARLGALEQTELWMADTTLQVLGCGEYLELVSNTPRDGLLSRRMCAILEELCC